MDSCSVRGLEERLEKKLLKPVDANGKAIKCSPTGDCEGGFDFTYTQHAAWPRASKKGSILSLTTARFATTSSLHCPK